MVVVVARRWLEIDVALGLLVRRLDELGSFGVHFAIRMYNCTQSEASTQSLILEQHFNSKSGGQDADH